MNRKAILIYPLVFAAALAFSPVARAQSASEWGNAIVGTGKDFLHSSENVFHKVADDPILIERTKSALDDDRVTRNQPIVVSADNGVVILRGRVNGYVAHRALSIARQVPGARGVNNEMLYEGSPTARNYTNPHHYYGPNHGPNDGRDYGAENGRDYAPDNGRNYAPGNGPE